MRTAQRPPVRPTLPATEAALNDAARRRANLAVTLLAKDLAPAGEDWREYVAVARRLIVAVVAPVDGAQ